MAKRSVSQEIGEQAENLVQGLFLKSNAWVCRDQTHDYGIDFEAELVERSGEVSTLTGSIIKIQVKGTRQIVFKSGHSAVRLKNEYLRYVMQFQTPVVLALANVTTDRVYFVWLQECLIGADVSAATGSTKVLVPQNNLLQPSLGRMGRLAEIALGVAPGAQLMAVQRLFEVFSAWYDEKAIDLIASLLEHLDERGIFSVFDSTLTKLMSRGPHVAYAMSQEYGRTLQELSKRFGGRYTSEHVRRMVVRGETYSLAGTLGLQSLYDNHPDHTAQLGLAEMFAHQELFELEWYCRFRERHHHLNSLEIWNRIKQLETEFPTGVGILHIPIVSRSDCHRRWPNLADGIYLKMLALAEGSA